MSYRDDEKPKFSPENKVEKEFRWKAMAEKYCYVIVEFQRPNNDTLRLESLQFMKDFYFNCMMRINPEKTMNKYGTLQTDHS